MRTVVKAITVEIAYSIGRQDPQEGIFEGGVPDPEHIEEVTIDLLPDVRYDETAGALVPTGKTQIEIRGSRRAYKALARYLLALTELKTGDPDYHDHFDDVSTSAVEGGVHLIVHAPTD